MKSHRLPFDLQRRSRRTQLGPVDRNRRSSSIGEEHHERWSSERADPPHHPQRQPTKWMSRVRNHNRFQLRLARRGILR